MSRTLFDCAIKKRPVGSGDERICFCRCCWTAGRRRYQKTNEALKTTAEKTTTFLGGLGSGLTAKLGAVKNSETFRSIEERVGSAYTNVKVSALFHLPVFCPTIYFFGSLLVWFRGGGANILSLYFTIFS